MTTEQKSLEKRLESQKQILAKLLEQEAGFGSLYVPAHIPVQINDAKKTIAELEESLENFPSTTYRVTLLGLTNEDTLVLKVSCKKAIQKNRFLMVNTEDILEELKQLGLSEEVINESLEVLDSEGYIKAKRYNMGVPNINHFTIQQAGFQIFAETDINDFDSIKINVISQIVNKGNRENVLIAAELKQPQIIIDHIIIGFGNQGLLTFYEYQGGSGNICVNNFSPKLKRILNEIPS